MTDQELKDLEALAEKATSGPWDVYGDSNIYPRFEVETHGGFKKICHINSSGNDYRYAHNDAAFIAAARAAVPALIAEVRRLRDIEHKYFEAEAESVLVWALQQSEGEK
jgi:hypothetical protein